MQLISIYNVGTNAKVPIIVRLTATLLAVFSVFSPFAALAQSAPVGDASSTQVAPTPVVATDTSTPVTPMPAGSDQQAAAPTPITPDTVTPTPAPQDTPTAQPTDTTSSADQPTDPATPTTKEASTKSLRTSASPSGGITGQQVAIGIQMSAPKTDQATGALIQEVPIQLPPGRNGTEPTLKLTYNSQHYENSPYGFGWDISIPRIERTNKAGVENMYTRNDFKSSIDGELLQSTASSTSPSTTYRARTDQGNFTKYIFQNNTWIVYDKHGTKYTYGPTSDSQTVDTASSTRTAVWMLQEVRDTNNNTVTLIAKNNDWLKALSKDI